MDLKKVLDIAEKSLIKHPSLSEVLMLLISKIDETSPDSIKIESGYDDGQSTESGQILHIHKVRRKRVEEGKSTVKGIIESTDVLQKISEQRLYLLRVISDDCYFNIWHSDEFIIVSCSYIEALNSH